MTDGQKLKDGRKVSQVSAIELEAEQEPDPPQAQAQEGEELMDGLTGQKPQEVGSEEEPEEEEMGAGSKQEARAGGDAQCGEG